MGSNNPTPRYIDPTTDYSFKRIFGSEVNKDLLIAFLGDLFRGRKTIKELEYNKNEHVYEIAHQLGILLAHFEAQCLNLGNNGDIWDVIDYSIHKCHPRRWQATL